MKIFLSYAGKDSGLALQLAERLRSEGFVVWIAEEEIVPGDNWAKKTGKALDDADLMVFLLTPSALESDRLQQDIGFAIIGKKYAGRVFSVFVGSTLQAGKGMPWILRKLPHRQVASAAGFSKVVKDIQDLNVNSGLSQSHA